MAELTINHAPRMGAAARLPDRPALLLGIFQGFSNVLVRVIGHILAFTSFSSQNQLYHDDEQRREVNPRMRIELPPSQGRPDNRSLKCRSLESPTLNDFRWHRRH